METSVAGRAPANQAQNGVSGKQAGDDANRQLTWGFTAEYVREINPNRIGMKAVLLQLDGACRDEPTLSLAQLP
jgi:hypothetical protein